MIKISAQYGGTECVERDAEAIRIVGRQPDVMGYEFPPPNSLGPAMRDLSWFMSSILGEKISALKEAGFIVLTRG